MKINEGRWRRDWNDRINQKWKGIKKKRNSCKNLRLKGWNICSWSRDCLKKRKAQHQLLLPKLIEFNTRTI
jgi:hypothetical protein